MVRSIRGDKVPNLFILQYSMEWTVNNLLLIPRFFFTESIIERRKPLRESARRAGWVGCNILVGAIPREGKISVVDNGSARPKEKVRSEYRTVQGLAELSPQVRGWALDVYSSILELRKTEFTLDEVYRFEEELQAKHPSNRNIRPKIRQQLQVLRDLGLVGFRQPGRYSLGRTSA
jgi:type II restriction enzyme